jgi:flagellar capping protein FliD
MTTMSEELLSSSSAKNQDTIKNSLQSLNDRVHMMEVQAQAKGEALRTSYSRWEENKVRT